MNSLVTKEKDKQQKKRKATNTNDKSSTKKSKTSNNETLKISEFNEFKAEIFTVLNGISQVVKLVQNKLSLEEAEKYTKAQQLYKQLTPIMKDMRKDVKFPLHKPNVNQKNEIINESFSSLDISQSCRDLLKSLVYNLQFFFLISCRLIDFGTKQDLMKKPRLYRLGNP